MSNSGVKRLRQAKRQKAKRLNKRNETKRYKKSTNN